MKRLLSLLVVISVVFSFSGCNIQGTQGARETLDIAQQDDRLDINEGLFEDEEGFFAGAWLSYIELLPVSFDGKEKTYRSYIEEIGKKLVNNSVTDLFVQVRPFCDAIYPSELSVPSSAVVGVQGKKLPFDFLSVIIDEMKKKNINVHAWINPLRVQNVFELSKLSDENIAKKWYLEKSINVKEAAGGLYLNPASSQVHTLLTDTVKELMRSYDLKGIHIDDYFYPTDEVSFDDKEYASYKSKGGTLDLYSYRREVISTLVSALYSTVKTFGKDKIFSVSPSADIEKNQNVLFADVKRWSSEDGFCDMIIPQIYFGFENETKPFDETASLWRKMVANSSKLCIGLALYKEGKEDEFAGKGRNEWLESSDIITRQIECARKLGCDGICYYSVSYMN